MPACLPAAGIDALKTGPLLHSYYSFSPHPGWRFVVIDGYDLSVLGWPPGHPAHEQAAQILNEKNPNQVGG
jgi:manganese-dependent ADP-ribose/CDP-alcohol diphosphatase